jgi:phenylacetate-CoA ligase
MIHGLEASQWDSPETLARGQRSQLALLLEWAVNNSSHYSKAPGYADVLAAVRRRPEALDALWSTLPMLTRADLRSGERSLRANGLPAGHGPLEEIGSSGSTGMPVRIATTALTRTIWRALTIREHLWRRRNFARRLGVVNSREAKDRVPGGQDFPNWGVPVAELYVTGPGSVIDAGFAVGELAAWLRRFDPHYLQVFPSIAASLLDALGEERPASLEEVRLFNEPVDPGLERRIASQWQVRCAELYSASEVGYIAFRCAEAGSLHVQAESVLVEILDDHGRACGVGETGRVVVTPLHNLATPLIRYDVGDYATVGARCACGRPTPVIARVRGRVRNMARTPDGRRFWPTYLVDNLGAVPAIRQAQFIQPALDRIELRVVLDRPLNGDEQRETIAIVRRTLGYPFTVDIVPVARIERGPTLKYEEFICRVQDERS